MLSHPVFKICCYSDTHNNKGGLNPEQVHAGERRRGTEGERRVDSFLSIPQNEDQRERVWRGHCARVKGGIEMGKTIRARFFERSSSLWEEVEIGEGELLQSVFWKLGAAGEKVFQRP